MDESYQSNILMDEARHLADTRNLLGDAMSNFFDEDESGFIDLENNLKEKNIHRANKYAEEATDHIYYIPEEFYNLSKEAKLSVFRLTSWTYLKSWDYNVFDLAEATGGHPLLFLGYAILGSPYSMYAMGKYCGAFGSGDVSVDDFHGYHFIDDRDLRIPMRKLCNYLRAIEDDYNSQNPYHNEIHAADVLQTLHVLIQMKGKLFPSTNEELFSILLAAAVHDVNHPGTNNAFQVNSATDVAILYNDISVLENRHVAHAFKKMIAEGQTRRDYAHHIKNRGRNSCEYNILCNVTNERFYSIKKRVIDAVLCTDMSKHFELVDTMKKLIKSGGITDDEKGPWEMLQFMLHLADISNPAKRKLLAVLWTDRVLEEFFAQGDLEQKLGLPISPNCDRRTTKKPDSQIGFISFVIKPSYEVLAQIIPSVQDQIIGPCIDSNLAYWKREKEKAETQDQR